ncbi:cytochrome c oxidase assembly protein [Actinokineospora auranticolor]|nr:cytochrome c oxidase assembly protein [Actinokineospora auranticolor]
MALPGARVVAEVAAVGVVGALVLAALLASTGDDRDKAVRVAGRLAGWWAILSAFMVVLTVADALGQGIPEVFRVLGPAVGRLSVALAWLVVANLAALVWVGSRLELPPGWLLAGAIVGVAPVALTGHSSSGGDHDIASDSLMLHVIAMSVWAGGLVALLAVARRSYGATAARTYSAIALACWIAVVVTGLVNASLRLAVDELGTRYGLLVVAKLAAAILLGGFGYLHRQRTLRQLDSAQARPFLRLAAVEVLLMLVTIGLAVGLSRTPSPLGARRRLSATEVLIGFPLPDPPSLGRLLAGWRPDLVFGTLAVAAAVWYLYRVGRRTEPWPVERTVAWLAGCAVLFIATCSGLGEYEPAVFSAHTVVRLLVGLVAPALLALGKPRALLGPVRVWLPRPEVAAFAASAIPVVLYGFGLYDGLAGQHWARLVILGCSLAAGVALFARTSRTPVVVVALAHGLTGLVLLCRETALGRGFYSRLALEWPHDVNGDQVLAGWVTLGVAVVVAGYAVRPAVVKPLLGVPSRTG